MKHNLLAAGSALQPMLCLTYLPIFKFRYDHDWTKWLLWSKESAILNICENRRLKKETCKIK